jgi:hypothetical protein
MKTYNILYYTTIIAVIIFIILYLLPFSEEKILSRPIWHNPKNIIDFELDGKGTSQQILDIYTFSHISHGIIFYHLLNNINIPLIKNNAIFIAILLEIAFEIFENTPSIINKYRNKKEFNNYKGDSIVNIIGDVLFSIVGYYFAEKYSKSSIIYLIITELLLIPYNASLLHLSINSLILS